MKIYLVGSLRNPKVPEVANKLREAGYEVFDDWYAAGPEADDYWQAYEKQRGHSYKEALAGLAAEHVFNFDKRHLDSSDVAVLVMPAGKSGFLELGYMIGQGKPGFILLDGEPERYDVMFKFAEVVNSVKELIYEIESEIRLISTIHSTNDAVDAARASLTAAWFNSESELFKVFKEHQLQRERRTGL